MLRFMSGSRNQWEGPIAPAVMGPRDHSLAILARYATFRPPEIVAGAWVVIAFAGFSPLESRSPRGSGMPRGARFQMGPERAEPAALHRPQETSHP